MFFSKLFINYNYGRGSSRFICHTDFVRWGGTYSSLNFFFYYISISTSNKLFHKYPVLTVSHTFPFSMFIHLSSSFKTNINFCTNTTSSTLYHLTPFLSNIHSFQPSTKDNSTLYHLTPFLSNIHSFISSIKDVICHSFTYQSIQSIPKLGLTICGPKCSSLPFISTTDGSFIHFSILTASLTTRRRGSESIHSRLTTNSVLVSPP